MEDLRNLKRKVEQYQEILANTINYRQEWTMSLRQGIYDQLDLIIRETGLDATLEIKDKLENLEGIILSLGETRSGISEKVNDEVRRHVIKHNGSLVYQQLFNGKIVVLITYPMIEGYGKERPPQTIGIYRPEELKPPFILRQMEEFLREITIWEDYDDDQPTQKIGFNMNFMDQPTPPIEG